MKKIFLSLLLIIPVLAVPILVTGSNSVFAADNSSSQTQTSVATTTEATTQAIPQITSQAVVPTASQEAIAACSGLYEKDSCQFHTSNALQNGTCKILPSGNNNFELGCQPEPSTKNAAIDPNKSTPNTKDQHQHRHKRS